MPDKEIKLLSEIKEFPHRIAFIESPCEEIQIAAVKQYPDLLQDITNPTPFACKIAVEKFFGVQIVEEITEDFIKKTELMFFLLTDINIMYDGNNLPNQDLLCDEYSKYDGKKFCFNNIAPTDTYQHTRKIIIDEYLKAVNLSIEQEKLKPIYENSK